MWLDKAHLGECSVDRHDALAGQHGTWTFTYVTGSYGIEDSGAIRLAWRMVSDWEMPQFTDKTKSGYSTDVDALRRMGANIHTSGRVAVVTGAGSLHGAKVTAPDLRGGAALVVAGLAARGETRVGGLGHIYRGYDDLEGELSRLGADIVLVP